MRRDQFVAVRDRIIKEKGGCCVRCCSTTSLELCRLDGTGGKKAARMHKGMSITKLIREGEQRTLICTTCRKKCTPHPTNDKTPPHKTARYNWFRFEWKPAVILALGGCCIDCASTENLEFDHIDPTTKSFHIASAYSRSDESLDEEVKKCVIRCRPCHLSKTSAERTGSLAMESQ